MLPVGLRSFIMLNYVESMPWAAMDGYYIIWILYTWQDLVEIPWCRTAHGIHEIPCLGIIPRQGFLHN